MGEGEKGKTEREREKGTEGRTAGELVAGISCLISEAFVKEQQESCSWF